MKTWLLLLLIANAATAAPIEFQGERRELVISKVSDRAIRIELVAILPDGKADVTHPTSALLPVKGEELLRVREMNGNRELAAGAMRVEISADPLSIALRRGDGSQIHALSFAAATNVSFKIGGPLLGLGEGAQQFDRRGAKYPMEPSWGAWNRAQLGSVVPSPFLIGTEGWALFAESPEGEFDLRESKGKFNPRAKAGLDLFVIDARQPIDALAEYTRLTGHAVMPPKWTFGYMQSHRTLAGPEGPLQIARTFREKKLPCDAVIYLGTGYCTNGWNTGHGSVTFNPNAFDHPAEAIRALHDLNLKVVLHVNHAPRDLFGLSFTEQSQSPRHIRNYWNRHRETFALGVDGWWPDDGDELPLEARLARHRCYFEGALQDRPDVRPWSLHRTGYAGAQRYGGWIWSGDIDGSWATLASQVSVGLNHSLSLTPFWGTDTGGFYPARELTGELYARWFEFSAFCPLFRSHGRTWHLRLPWGWNTGEPGPLEHASGPDASELHNAQVEPICRKYLELRYRMLPYNYSLAREACDTGMPMMRALWLHYPNDPQAVKLGDEYLWGRDVLVAPVVQKGVTSRRVYLPQGEWFDFWTNQKSRGGEWIQRDADLETLPLFVRAGAIIPLDPVRQFTSERVNGPTTLKIYPGADGVFPLYDDDGQSLNYTRGEGTIWIQVRWLNDAKKVVIESDPRMKTWRGPAREFSVEIANAPSTSKKVKFDGAKVEVAL